VEVKPWRKAGSRVPAKSYYGGYEEYKGECCAIAGTLGPAVGELRERFQAIAAEAAAGDPDNVVETIAAGGIETIDVLLGRVEA
jgi:hypothetical protein